MELTSIIRIAFLPIGIGWLLLYIHKIYTNSDRIGKSAIIKSIVSVTLLPIHPLISNIKDVDLSIYLFGIASQYYSAIFAYMSFKQLENDIIYLPVLKNRPFQITTILTSISIILFYLNKDNLKSFSDNENFTPTIQYYTAYTLNYGILLAIGISILLIFKRKGWENQNIAYKTQRIITTIAIGSLTAGFFIMTVNVLLSIIPEYTSRPTLNGLYHLSKSIGATLLILSFISSEFMTRIVQPLQNQITTKNEKQYELLLYLHKHLTHIIPDVILNHNAIFIEDILTEIADARMILWSYHKHRWWYTAKHEAKIISDYIQSGITLDGIGQYSPPKGPRNELKYNAAVAYYLKQMTEKQ